MTLWFCVLLVSWAREKKARMGIFPHSLGIHPNLFYLKIRAYNKWKKYLLAIIMNFCSKPLLLVYCDDKVTPFCATSSRRRREAANTVWRFILVSSGAWISMLHEQDTRQLFEYSYNTVRYHWSGRCCSSVLRDQSLFSQITTNLWDNL